MLVWFAEVWKEIRQATRVLAMAPGFSIACVMMLGLGIGLASSVFSVVNPLLFRPLPFKAPERLVYVMQARPRQNLEELNLSYADYLDWRRQNHVFSSMGILSGETDIIGGGDRPEPVHGERISASLFSSTLGVQPMIGRDFNEADERPGSPRVVLISHRLWQSRYAGDPGVLGKTLDVNGSAYTVTGVMPPKFSFQANADLWMPVVITDIENTRGVYQYNGFARLKPGVTRQEAQTELSAIAARIERVHPISNAGIGALVQPMRQAVLRDTQPMSWILLVASCLVMVLACVNVSNLFLVRAIGRQKEFAIRLAVGASRGQIVRQLLTEGMILAALAGSLGLACSAWGTRLWLALANVRIDPWLDFSLDGRVLGFAIGASVLTCILFALAPAWTVTGMDAYTVLKDSGTGAGDSRHHHRLRGLLIIGEVALAMVLLSNCGMMLHALGNLQAVDPGFNPDRLATFTVILPMDRYLKQESRAAFYRTLCERLRSMPGVKAVGGISRLPLNGSSSWQSYTLEGEPPHSHDQPPIADFRLATPDYFATMEIPLIKGRTFNDSDNLSSTRVAIVDEAFARKHFNGQNPIGRRFMRGALSPSPRRNMEIVGVVADVKTSGLDKQDRPCFYMAYAQFPWTTLDMSIRVSGGDALNVIAGARGVLHEIDPCVPLSEPREMRDIVEKSYWSNTYILKLFGIFSGLALLLAASGIAGVMMCITAQRTREIGIRMALGAQPDSVMRLILLRGMSIVVIGLAFGFAASLASARALSNFLFHVGPVDLVSILGSIVIFAAVAMAACYIPSRRAMHIDPIKALRTE